MNLSWDILLVLGVTVSSIFTIMLIWFSKKNVTTNLSRHYILHMLNAQAMSVKEISETAKEGRNGTIWPRQVPVLLVKLQEEGLIQRGCINRYVITSRGLEALKNLDAINKEFQRVASVMQKTSSLNNLMVRNAIDTLATIPSVDNTNIQGRFTLAANEGSGCSNYRMNTIHEIGRSGGFYGIHP